jgi:hypothetical protein
MKRKEFFDIDQANAYLSNSVIRLGEDPIYVHNVYSGKSGVILSYWKLGAVGGSIALKETKLDNPDLDMSPVKLGMLATGKESKATIYCSRMSRRAWKWGLSSGSLDLTNISNDRQKRVHFNKNSVLYSNSLLNTIKGDYLKYDAALKISNEENLPIAFSRNFAVWGEDLYYKYIGQPVGKNKKTFPSLEEGFEWVYEVLQEDLNG